ncbi:hypothetical protein [Streptomyces sp. NBC_00989]|uniref:hypothetical protein n=1 Tax=Streptomyces sp. NBC_00989 TaxID=2903705 RepID=UPI0038665366|nr:hypothetical protein OG714_38200 [Streptomyces sp. NBC_00989]
MTDTVHTGGRAARPVLTAPTFRVVLPVDEQTGTRVIAEIPPAEDVPPGYPPQVAVWFQGSDTDMDAAALDVFLADLDRFRDGLRALRLLMATVWPNTPEGPRP